jgi:hypothetical protein
MRPIMKLDFGLILVLLALLVVQAFAPSKFSEELMKLPHRSIAFFSIALSALLAPVMAHPALAQTANVYIAQSAAGAGNGADCADAYAVTFFNSSSNWGTSSSKIGPGTTVHLCGTITSALTAKGSGSSGSPITILFDSATSAQMSFPAVPTSGAINVSNQSYITIDGQNVGIIQSTNNGSSAGGYANQVCSVAILATSAANITVQNLQVLNLYVHTTTSDNSAGGCMGVGPPSAVIFPGATGPMTFNNVTCTYAATCFNGDAGNTAVTVSNSTCQNFDHCLGMGNNNTTPTVKGPVYFYNNNLNSMTAWDSTGNNWHHDGIHLFAYCSDGGSYCSGTYWNAIYIYNNHFHGDPGANFNSWIFNEENIHNEWVFNNWIDSSARALVNGAGPVYGQGTSISVINNTFIGNISQGVTNLNMGGPNLTNENNANCSGQLESIMTADESGQNATTVSTIQHNYDMNGNSNAFIWKGTFLNAGQFPTWESDSGETASAYSAGCSISSSGTLQAGSVAIGGGANLFSKCSGQPIPGLGALCSDAAGNARSSTGTWDAGAFSSAVPPPPAGLQATVIQSN